MALLSLLQALRGVSWSAATCAACSISVLGACCLSVYVSPSPWSSSLPQRYRDYSRAAGGPLLEHLSQGTTVASACLVRIPSMRIMCVRRQSGFTCAALLV